MTGLKRRNLRGMHRYGIPRIFADLHETSPALPQYFACLLPHSERVRQYSHMVSDLGVALATRRHATGNVFFTLKGDAFPPT